MATKVRLATARVQQGATGRLRKGLRDLLWIAAGSALLALAEETTDLGVPSEFAPIVSAAALYAWRTLRAAFGKAPANE